MSDRKKLRVGLCGLGEIGQFHLQAINGSDEAELAAVCELDADLAAKSVGENTAIFDDFTKMLAEADLDVVDICLPHHLHVPFATEALRADCHVILEKPIATDLPGCDEIAAAAAASGRRVGISYNQVFFAPHRRLAEMLDQGQLGDLRSLYMRLWMGGKYGGWREDSTQVGGGLLMDAGIHRVYMASRFGGKVQSVSAEMDNPRSEDSFTITLNFESGATGVIQGSYHGPDGVFDDSIGIQASNGMAEVLGCEAFFEGDLKGETQLRLRQDGEWKDDPVSDRWDDSVRASVGAILGSFAEDTDPEIGLAEGRETVAIVEAAYRSAEQGVRIRISDL
ncbi:MAG: Gfo/Idh/MocA family oxidoreductase [Solirubrobacterales bacterium]